MLITDKDIRMEFNLPYFKKNEIKVRINKNSAEIRGEKKHESKIKRKDFFHEERHSHSFHYATTLPNVNPKKAKMTFSKGKLKIKVPKI